MSRPTAEYAQWLADNNFSPEDEQLILRTANNRMLLWLLLSCIPGVGYFTLPLFMMAWSMRKIIKQRNFQPNPGILYSLCAVAMYFTFLMIIPLIIWLLAKKFNWGSGLRRLIKKGKVGNGYHEESAPQPVVKKRRSGIVVLVIVLIVALLLMALVAALLLSEKKEPTSAPQVETVSNKRSVPDLVTMGDPEKAAQWAAENDMQLQITYVDELGNIYTTQPEGTILGIVDQQPASGTLMAPGGTVQIIVCVQLPPSLHEQLLGSWNSVYFNQFSLYLDVITFADDDTFTTSRMAHMQVDFETDLYLFGCYWDGTMGADDAYGTYSLQEDMLTLHYQYYDEYIQQEISYQQTFQVVISDETLTLIFVCGDQVPRQEQQVYQCGAKPDPDMPLPEGLYTGYWIFHGQIHEHEIQEFDLYYSEGGRLILHADGTFEIDYIALSYSGQDGWYYMGGGGDCYRGTYAVDGQVITLNYTDYYQSNFDDEGNWLGNDWIPYEETATLTMSTLSDMTQADFGKHGVCTVMRISANTSGSEDWIDFLLSYMRSQYPN